jgi:tripeptidyl-peptidase-1
MRLVASLFLFAVAVQGLWVRKEADLEPWTPEGWKMLVEKPRSDTPLAVTFVLKHDPQARERLHNILMRISDPREETYGQWLSIAEVTEIMQVSQEKLDVVSAYLARYGVHGKILINRDMIDANISIGTLERMLNTEFRAFEKNGETIYRVIKPYFLPTTVAEIVSYVDPVLRFPTAEPRMHRVGAIGNWPDHCGASCTGKITPWVLQQQYGIDAPPSKPTGNSSVAVAEFQGQQYDYADLNSFANSCSLSQYKINLIGTNTEAKCQLYEEACIESLLDLEYMASLTQPIPITDYYSDTYSILDWAKKVDVDSNAPLVHSVSYGNDEVQQTSADYIFSCNDEFLKIVSRGITIAFASGDQGVWGRSGTGTGHFNPDFPAASPYILAVGGSDLSTTSIGPETCCADSGGGFSNYFSRPSYQDSAVKTYFATATLPNQNLYNASGRGYPDVSAIFGLHIPYCMVADNKYFGVGGTSASSPIVASMIGLLNDVRLAKGGAPLGFANPLIYQLAASNPEAFNDITTGKNDGGFSTGFSAAKGWDPCTGVGTLNYNILKTLV